MNSPSIQEEEDSPLEDEWPRWVEDPSDRRQIGIRVYNVSNGTPVPECKPLLHHGVVAGSTWGTMTSETDKRTWSAFGCDAETSDERYSDLLDRNNLTYYARAYMEEQKRIEGKIQKRLDQCLDRGTCPWIAHRAPLTVVLARWKEDIEWVKQLDPRQIDVVVYSRLGAPDENRNSTYFVPHNYGEEAPVYLQYILEHYDNGQCRSVRGSEVLHGECLMLFTFSLITNFRLFVSPARIRLMQPTSASTRHSCTAI